MLTALCLSALAALPEPGADAKKLDPVWSRTIRMPAASSAFSPDGQFVAFGHLDSGRIVLTHVSTGKIVRTFRQPEGGRVMSIDFSADGKRMETRSWVLTDLSFLRVIRLWEVQTGKELFVSRNEADFETVMQKLRVFSPDRKTLAVSDRETTIRLVDVATGKDIRKLPEHNGIVSSIQFSSDGTRLASCDGECVFLWDASTGKELGRRRWREQTIYALHFRSDRLLTATRDKTTERWPMSSLWDFAEPRRITVSPFSLTGPVSPDGTLLAALTGLGPCNGGALMLWDVKTAKAKTVLAGQIHATVPPIFAENGKVLAFVWTSTEESPVAGPPKPHADLFAVPSGSHLAKITVPGGVNAVAISPDGRTITAAGEERCLVQRLTLVPVHASTEPAGFLSPNRQFRATVDGEGKIRIVDRATGQALHTLADLKAAVKVVTFSSGGEYVAAAGDGKVCLWTTGKGRLRQSWAGLPGPIESLAFVEDSDILEARTPSKVFRWNLRTGKEVSEIER
jgi:WD40 repeat protein